MKITGIIVEYNPLHLGHIHHIQQTRQLTQCDILVAVMSPNFTQRGSVACVDKFERTKKALEHHVDVVIELPTIYATQSASVFAQSAVKLLHLAQVDTIVFGSETNDINTLRQIAQEPFNQKLFEQRISEGESFAHATNHHNLSPNDILGVSYIKAANTYNIQTQCILRTNQYHDKDLSQPILSASAIRHGVKNNQYSNQAMVDLTHFVFDEAIYPHLRYRLLSASKSELQNNLLVSEGIENLFIEKGKYIDNYDEFIQACVSKRYSQSRIQRTCLSIVLNHQSRNLHDLDFIRILGFRKEATSYLKRLPSKVTQFKDLPEVVRENELKATLIYSLLSTASNLMSKEIGKPIIV